MSRDNLLHQETTGAIIAAMYSVHRELGYGFLERVYGNAMSVMLREAGHAVIREVPYSIVFHGEEIGRYRADLIVNDKVLVEVKTGKLIDPSYVAQVTNYLKASRIEVGLLLNLGPSAEFKRVVSTRN